MFKTRTLANLRAVGLSALTVLGLGLALGLTATGSGGRVLAGPQDPPTAAGKLKQKVGGAIESIKKGAANADQAVREQLARARSGISAMGTEARVYARIHWDKALYNAKIDLSAPQEGVIVLSGVVPDARAKAKAVELTAETVGVREVVDRLTVQTTASGARPDVKGAPKAP